MSERKMSEYLDQDANPIPEDELVHGYPAHYWENDSMAFSQEKLRKVYEARKAGHPDPWSVLGLR